MDNDEIIARYEPKDKKGNIIPITANIDTWNDIKAMMNQARADERAKIVEMLENLDKGDAVYNDDKTYYPYIRVNWSVIIQKIKEMP